MLLAVATKLKNFHVRWFTDNQNVARILLMGSKKPLLHDLAVKVFSLSVHNNVKLEPEWIPRDLNERADALSRIIDYDDWMLNPAVFADIEVLWGPHSVDRFASCHNCQIPRFNSRCSYCVNNKVVWRAAQQTPTTYSHLHSVSGCM